MVIRAKTMQMGRRMTPHDKLIQFLSSVTPARIKLAATATNSMVVKKIQRFLIPL
jgi:hypothetical protein